MQKELSIFSSFQEADEAEHHFYASLTPQERLDLLLELVHRRREALGEAAEGFARIYRVVERPRG